MLLQKLIGIFTSQFLLKVVGINSDIAFMHVEIYILI